MINYHMRILNDTVVKDNRIPPFGMAYDEARLRNILPVPADQYGSPGAGGAFDYWDEFDLNPPQGAASGTIGVALAGLAGTRRVLNQAPLLVLRQR